MEISNSVSTLSNSTSSVNTTTSVTTPKSVNSTSGANANQSTEKTPWDSTRDKLAGYLDIVTDKTGAYSFSERVKAFVNYQDNATGKSIIGATKELDEMSAKLNQTDIVAISVKMYHEAVKAQDDARNSGQSTARALLNYFDSLPDAERDLMFYSGPGKKWMDGTRDFYDQDSYRNKLSEFAALEQEMIDNGTYQLPENSAVDALGKLKAIKEQQYFDKVKANYSGETKKTDEITLSDIALKVLMDIAKPDDEDDKEQTDSNNAAQIAQQSSAQKPYKQGDLTSKLI